VVRAGEDLGPPSPAVVLVVRVALVVRVVRAVPDYLL
jgi:hypothetical protein